MPAKYTIITVSLNPAIDRTIEVERLTPGEHQVGRELSRTPGGKGVNVSRVLAAWGIANVATGFLGKGNRSDFESFLTNPLITDAFVTLPGRTRENVTLADRATGLDTHIRDQGLKVSPADVTRLMEILGKLCNTDTIVVFSGSLPPGVAPDTFEQMVQQCLNANAKVVVDTSGLALQAIKDKPLLLIKPNVLELSQLLNVELETQEKLCKAAEELTGLYQMILLSCGEDGAYLFSQPETLHATCPALPQEVRNTVGCGDVLLGTFLAGFVRQSENSIALQNAVASASACACHTAAATFDQNLVDQLRPLVDVKKLR